MLPSEEQHAGKTEGPSVVDHIGSAQKQWWKNRSLVLSMVVTAWMLSIAKYNEELGPIFVSAPIEQASLVSSSNSIKKCQREYQYNH